MPGDMSAAARSPQGRDARARRAEIPPAPTDTRRQAVGNTLKILVSELSGASTSPPKPARSSTSSTTSLLAAWLEKVQDLEHAGYQFEPRALRSPCCSSQVDRALPILLVGALSLCRLEDGDQRRSALSTYGQRRRRSHRKPTPAR